MKSERKTYRDPVAGIEVTQWTDYRGHSHHLYFTNAGWYAGGRKLLFGSDRNGRTNLFGVDLATGEIEQHTDLEPLPFPHEVQFVDACLNPRRDEAYFWYGRRLTAVDLATQRTRTVWEADPFWRPSMLNASCDGLSLYFALFEDLADRIRTDLLRGYVGFRETWEQRPLSRVVRVGVDDGRESVALEEKAWIGHVNTSPAVPTHLTYCHEGPWLEVDNRIWGLDAATGRTWKIAPKSARFAVGHEYWYQDGRRIGFHGITSGTEMMIGGADFDGTNAWEASQTCQPGHIFSLDDRLIVGDGFEEGVLRLWKREDGTTLPPRALCRHDSTAKIQQLHVHPRIAPDGKSVFFTSDRGSGYGNVYSVPLPGFESLPEWPLP